MASLRVNAARMGIGSCYEQQRENDGNHQHERFPNPEWKDGGRNALNSICPTHDLTGLAWDLRLMNRSPCQHGQSTAVQHQDLSI